RGQRLVTGEGLRARANAPPLLTAQGLDVGGDRGEVVGDPIPLVAGEDGRLSVDEEVNRDAWIAAHPRLVVEVRPHVAGDDHVTGAEPLELGEEAAPERLGDRETIAAGVGAEGGG